MDVPLVPANNTVQVVLMLLQKWGSILTTLKQLALELKMTEKQIADRLDDIFRLYQMEKKWFKKGFNDDSMINTPYSFNDTSYEIMKALLKAIDSYPLVKSESKITKEHFRINAKNRLNIGELQRYYQLLISAIDEISDDEMRVQIKGSPIYEKTIVEITGMSSISGKFSHFLAASNQISEMARMQLWQKLYREIDGLIYACYDSKVEREEEFQRKFENIKLDHQESIDIVTLTQPPFTEETIKGLEDQCEKELQKWTKIFAQENTYNSLDKFLVQMMLEEAYKHHYKSLTKEVTEKEAKIAENFYKPYLISDVRKLVTLDEEEKSKASSVQAEMIERITGYTYAELKQADLQEQEKKANKIREKLEGSFNNLELTEMQVKKALQKSIVKSNDYSLGELNRRMVGAKLQSIYNQLASLHEDVSGVLYEPLTELEQNDYQRVLAVVEQTLGSIDLLNEPSQVREGKMQDYYEGYLSFYQETKQQSEEFEAKAQAFTISTSIEALEIELPEKKK